MGRLENRVAIVTGGAQGLGASSVESLASEGATVILCDTNVQGGKATAAQHGAQFYELDVREERHWEALMAETTANHGRLDILVNNAGIFISSPVDETSLDDFRRVLDINVIGCFLGCKHGIRAMKKNAADITGSIINISSVTGLRGQIGGGAYTTSKGGVRLLTKTVAVENAGNNIRCNSIHPGVMRTPMLDALYASAGDEAQAMQQHLESTLPMGTGSADDIGDMVVFLASDESRYITGTEMVVDGGMTAGLPT